MKFNKIFRIVRFPISKELQKKFNSVILGLVLFLCTTCSSSKVEPVYKNPDFKTGENTYYWDDMAELLSALPLNNNNRFRDIINQSKYSNYSKNINKYWKAEEENYINVVVPWRNKNIQELSNLSTTIYPLSGADFINMYHFYPNSTKFIMVGLQRPGHILDPRDLKPDEFTSVLPNLESLVYELSSLNYYTSKRLERDSKNKFISGVGPILLIFIKRLGFTIYDFKQVSLGDQGNLIEKEGQNFERTEEIPGIQIRFFRQGEEKLRELYFFKIFLKSTSMDLSTAEGKFFALQKRYNLIFKSAEYILQTDEYTDFNKSIMSRADRIIEDESGIPIRLISDEWDKMVFGRYLGRVPLSKTPNVPFQIELAKLYQEQNPDVLPFHFGYGIWKGKGKSNLIFLKRKLISN